MFIEDIEQVTEEEIEVKTEKVEAAEKEKEGVQGSHGPLNHGALLATDHSYNL